MTYGTATKRHPAAGTLWDRPLAHRSDPVTSYEAGEDAESTGQAGRQRQAVLKAVETFPGSTSAELAAYMGVSRHMPARRLSELERQGLIEKGVARLCSKCGRRCVSWWITSRD